MVNYEIDYSKVPVQYMVGPIQRWIERGYRPGSFLESLLRNDLFGAIGSADDSNRKLIWEWCTFLYNYAPSFCYGSDERFETWHKHFGLSGQQA